jgi:hypothetical protein
MRERPGGAGLQQSETGMDWWHALNNTGVIALKIDINNKLLQAGNSYTSWIHPVTAKTTSLVQPG